MKRVIAILLAALLLCGSLAALPAVAAQPEAGIDEITAEISSDFAQQPSFRRSWNYIRYRSTLQLQYNADIPVNFRVSPNLLGITVDENGLVTSSFSLRKYGHVFITMHCDDGNILDTTILTVDADMWQWMMIIFLLGWFWY